MEYTRLIIEIIVGTLTVVPLAISLVKYIIKSIKEKNWQSLLTLAMSFMEQAEQNYSTGAERKEWVLSMLKSSAKTINYNYNEEEFSKLIDNIVALTNKVNSNKSDS